MKTKYSEDSVKEIIALKELGVPDSKIARRWGVTRQVIPRWLKKYKEKKPRRNKTSPLTSNTSVLQWIIKHLKGDEKKHLQ